MESGQPKVAFEDTEQAGSSSRSRWWMLAVILGLPLPIYCYMWITYPSDHTPRGAYLRVARAVNQTQPAAFFAYTEEAAQHACFSILDYRKKSLELVRRDFPTQQKKKFEEKYSEFSHFTDGAEVFAQLAIDYGWLDQLRRDMSGVDKIEISGPRATVQTVKGTRYPFRRRPGGIWGLTAFTPALVDEAEKAARDFKLVDKAAADYRRVQNKAEK